MAVTNRDLKAVVENNKSRAGPVPPAACFSIERPPLRDRREEPLLTRYFAQRHAHRMGRNIDAVPTAVLAALTNCDWPGNIREPQKQKRHKRFRCARVCYIEQAHEAATKTIGGTMPSLGIFTADISKTDSGRPPAKVGRMLEAGKDPSLVFTGETPPRRGRSPAPRGRWFCNRNTR